MPNKTKPFDWFILLVAMFCIFGYFAYSMKQERDCDKAGGVWLRQDLKCIDAKELK